MADEDAISRTEAIRVASGYCHWTNIPDELAKLPSVNPIPCEDAISRKQALDAFGLSEKTRKYGGDHSGYDPMMLYEIQDVIEGLPSVSTKKTGRWIPVSERLPETDNENSINNYNVLLWVKNKSHPEREPQIYLGKLRHVDGDDGSDNFWGIETKPCEWTIWGWSYFNEPEVIAWMPLPQPYKAESEE